MAKCLAEVFFVVITGEGQDGAAVAEETGEDFLQMAHGVAQRLSAGQFAEQIARDEEDVDALLPAILAHALDGLAQVVGSIDSTESVGEVPVSGVQNTHGSLSGSPSPVLSGLLLGWGGGSSLPLHGVRGLYICILLSHKVVSESKPGCCFKR